MYIQRKKLFNTKYNLFVLYKNIIQHNNFFTNKFETNKKSTVGSEANKFFCCVKKNYFN